MKKYNVAVIGYGWVSSARIQAVTWGQVAPVYSSRSLDGYGASVTAGVPAA